MKKKLTIAFLLSLSCACVCLATACNNGNDDPSSSSGTGETHTLTLQGGEGYTFQADGLTYNATENEYTVSVQENTPFSFAVDLGAFYAGTPTVTVGGVALAEKNGMYSVTLSEDTTVSVSGVRKDVSAMLGSGSLDDAFVVSRPIDLVYIADQVNKGNEAYSRAYYVLGNDIDCKGEELKVIGDMNNENAFFSGCFSCVTDGTEMERFTISNFTINAKDTGFAGLFGFVQSDMSITSSGLFYGIRIDNFTINATSTSLPTGERSIYCGGLIGYGVGVKSYLCDATNGEINVACDINELSFVGGLFGILQGTFVPAYNYMGLAEVAYSTVDVDVNVLHGSTLAAGGIVGYTLTNSLVAPAFIHNSYSTGNITGAIRTGGIVGVLGQYTSVASSYASGNVVANARNTADTDGFLPEFCIAYAGGLIGYAENDTVVNDSFSVSTLTAIAADGASAQKIGKATGGMDEAGKTSVASQPHQVINCPETVDVNSLLTTLTKDLGWQTVNWNIQDKTLPTINYEASTDSTTTTLTVHYVTKDGTEFKPVKVNQQETDSCSYIDSYAPLVDALNAGSLAQYAKTDNGGLLSYGYFFDEACTHPVPYAYVTTRSVDLYMGFANPSDIVGEYNVVTTDGSSVTLTITADREAIVSNGASSISSPYYYDGKTLTIEGTRLAQFFQGEVDASQSINEDTDFDFNRYMFYYFQAEKSTQTITLGNNTFQTETLRLHDGVYFTANAPLYAFAPNDVLPAGEYYVADTQPMFLTLNPDYTGVVWGGEYGYATFRYGFIEQRLVLVLEDGSNSSLALTDLKSYDAFKGEWRVSASINDFFSFDGLGNWSSFHRVYTRVSPSEPLLTNKLYEETGTYEAVDSKTLKLKLSGIDYATVTFDAEGMLKVTYQTGETVTLSQTQSLKGLWESSTGSTLQLNGFNTNGLGMANLHYVFKVNGITFKQTYELTYETSATDNYYCLYLKDEPFGYFYYYEYAHVLIATLVSPIGDGSYETYSFTLNHEIGGDWISETMADFRFNGLGYFDIDGNWTSTLTIGNDEVVYVLNKTTLSGSFNYNGQQYTIAYDHVHHTLTVTQDSETVLLQRKDDLTGLRFVDKNNTQMSFSFDGKSKLSSKGKLTVNGTDIYEYSPNAVNENQFDVYQNNAIVGALVYNTDTASYSLTLSGNTYSLYLYNDYMGQWAISGDFDAFTIYPSNLDGFTPVQFKGQEVLMRHVDSTTLTFDCIIDRMPMTYYLFIINDENEQFQTFALSQYASSAYGNYQFCERVDNVFGTWVSNSDSNMTMTFDGVNNDYVNGMVNLTYKLGNLPAVSTPYYYRTYEDGEIFIWSQQPIGENTYYYKLVPCATDVAGAYVKDGQAFKRVEVDALYKTKATETETGYTFLFDGMNIDDDHLGEIIATKDGSETITYSYDVVSYNANQTATLTLVNLATNETFKATLYYSNPQDIKITLEKVEANA